MEAHPPSYKEAESSLRNPWPLVARYLTRQQLVTACLVCRVWNQIFNAQLLGDPGSLFPDPVSSDADAGEELPFFDLIRFSRCLRLARPETRALVHTLRITP